MADLREILLTDTFLLTGVVQLKVFDVHHRGCYKLTDEHSKGYKEDNSGVEIIVSHPSQKPRRMEQPDIVGEQKDSGA